MPDIDGLDVVSKAREAGCQTTPIVIVTAQNTMDNAIEAMKRGAYDYIDQAVRHRRGAQLVPAARSRCAQLSTDLQRLERELRGRFEVGVAIVGNSSRRCRRSTRPSAASRRPTRRC